MDLSKDFDTKKYDFLAAKLYTSGFNKGHERFSIVSPVIDGTRKKINKQFSSWQEWIQGVLQVSFLSPLLFNILPKRFVLSC